MPNIDWTPEFRLGVILQASRQLRRVADLISFVTHETEYVMHRDEIELALGCTLEEVREELQNDS